MIKLFLLTNLAVAILLGQSNQEGRDTSVCMCKTDTYGVANVWYYQYRSNGWQNVMKIPSGAFSFGPEYSLCKSRRLSLAVLKITSNSTSLAADWTPGGHMWTSFTNAAAVSSNALVSLGYNPVWSSIGWNQGETDSVVSNNAVNYHFYLTNFITRARAFLGTNVPFVIARTAWQNCGAYSNETRSGQMQATGTVSGVTWFDTDDLPQSTQFSGHFNGDGQIILGQRYDGALP